MRFPLLARTWDFLTARSLTSRPAAPRPARRAGLTALPLEDRNAPGSLLAVGDALWFAPFSPLASIPVDTPFAPPLAPITPLGSAAKLPEDAIRAASSATASGSDIASSQPVRYSGFDAPSAGSPFGSPDVWGRIGVPPTDAGGAGVSAPAAGSPGRSSAESEGAAAASNGGLALPGTTPASPAGSSGKPAASGDTPAAAASAAPAAESAASSDSTTDAGNGGANDAAAVDNGGTTAAGAAGNGGSTEATGGVTGDGSDGKADPRWLTAGLSGGVAYERNVGQAGAGADFIARGKGYAVFLSAAGATFKLAGAADAETGRPSQQVVGMTFVGANASAAVSAGDLQTGRSNYYLDGASYADVERYGTVRYSGVYDGVDAVYRRSEDGSLEYDFEVAAGADAGAVRLRFDGADAAAVDEDGSLRIRTAAGDLVQRAPVAYQTDAAGARRAVASRFVANADGSVGLSVGRYDRSRALVVDPVVSFGAVVAGSGADAGLDAAVDADGNTLVTGWTLSPDLPMAVGAFAGTVDAYVTKIDPTGVVLSTTYLGGSLNDYGLGVAAAPDGTIYATGVTQYLLGSATVADQYVTHLSATGAILGGGWGVNGTGWTLLDGTATAGAYFLYTPATSRDGGIAVDAAGHVHVVGTTFNPAFPTTVGAFQTTFGGRSDAVVVELDAPLATVYKSYHGGSGIEHGNGVAVTAAGDVWVVGGTSSTNLPTASPFQGFNAGGTDAFALRLTPAGALAFATYDGTGGPDEATGVAVVGGGVVLSQTSGFQVAARRITSAGAAGYRIVLGPGDAEAVASDGAGGAWLAGTTPFLFQLNPVQAGYGGGASDGFLVHLDGSGIPLLSTYAGGVSTDGVHGVAVGWDGDVVAAGTTDSWNFPTPHFAASTDAFVLRLSLRPPAPVVTSVTTDAGASATDFVTNDNTLTVSGAATAGALVRLYSAGTLVGSATASGGGAWSVVVASAFADGRYPLTATAELAGRVSAPSAARDVLVDTAAPAVALRLPPAGPNPTPTVEVFADDGVGVGVADGATVSLDVDLNGDSAFTGGELGYAAGTMTGGYARVAVANPLPAGTYGVRARAADLAGNVGASAVGTLSVVAGAWAMTDATRDYDPNAGVGRSHALDLDRSPGTASGGSPALTYNSRTVSVRPVVQATVQTDGTVALPPTMTVELVWDGVSQGVTTYSTFGYSPGQLLTVAAQPLANQTGIGRHTWALNVAFPGSAVSPLSVSGATFVVSQDANPYGAGWDFSLAERIVDVAAAGGYPAGKLRVYGDGNWDFYQSNGSGGWTSPAGDFGVLTPDGSGGYVHTLPSNETRRYNSDGMMTSWASADAFDTVSLAYVDADADGLADDVGTVTAADGAVTTFSYTAGRLTSASTATGLTTRAYSFTQTGADLTGIANPDGGARAFGYDSGHRLTSDVWAGTYASWAYSPSSGLLAAATTGTGIETATAAVTPEAGYGLAAPWQWDTAAEVVDPLGKASYQRHDAKGRLLQAVDGRGGTEAWTVLANGLVGSYTDALGNITTYAYDADGYLLTETLPDTTTRKYTYATTPYHTTLTAKDEAGRTVTYTADAYGHTATATDADGVVTRWTYSSATGRLTDIRDTSNAVVESFGYDAYRRLVTATLPLSGTETTTYDAQGNVATVQDRRGTTATYTNDALGRALSVQTPNGAGTGTVTVSATYDGMGRELTATTALGAVGKVTRNTAGDVVRTTAGEGTAAAAAWLTVRDANGRAIGQRDAAGRMTTAARNATGDVVRVADGTGAGSTFTVDLDGRTTAATDGRGLLTTFVVDKRGRTTQATNPDGKTSKTAFDATGAYTGSLNPYGKGPTANYTAAGRSKQSLDANGNGVTTVYDGNGRVQSVADGAGGVTFTTYNADGQVATVTVGYGSAAALTSTYAYYSSGDLWTVTTPTGTGTATTTYAYDKLGNAVTVTDANGGVTRSAYDDDGNRVAVTTGFGTAAAETTTSAYDVRGRRVAVTDGNGVTTRDVLDANGASAGSIDGTGNLTVVGRDAAGRVSYTRAADGGLTRRTYDLNGNLATITDPSGNTTSYLYDREGRLTVTTDPAGKTVTNVYDDAGRLTQRTDRLGRVEIYGYDDADRLTSEIWKTSGGATVDTLGYTYFGDGSTKTASNGAGTYTFTYDGQGRVKTQADTYNGVTITYGYGAAGDLTSVADSLGGTTAYGYDDGHRLTSARQSGTGVVGIREEFDYNASDLVSESRRYDATTGGALVGKTLFGYDAGGRMTSEIHKDGTGGTLVNYANAYNANNGIATETRNGTARNFGYDSTSQVTSDSGTGMAYSYDLNGNRTMAGYSTGPANRMVSDGLWNYAYDDEGNVSSKTLIAGGDYWEYGYDWRNQMVSAVEKNSAGGTVVQTIGYGYDVFGNQVSKTVGGVTTDYSYEINDASPGFTKSVNTLLAELNGGSVTTRYLNVGADAIARSDGTNAFWLLADRIGSVREVTDGTGAVVSAITYTAFGGVQAETNSALSGDVLYTKGHYDRDAKLYNLHWRTYDPLSGQWTSEDPIGFAAGDMNTRRYVGNDATNGVDRSGLEPLETWVSRQHPEVQAQIRTEVLAWKKSGDAKELYRLVERYMAMGWKSGEFKGGFHLLATVPGASKSSPYRAVVFIADADQSEEVARKWREEAKSHPFIYVSEVDIYAGVGTLDDITGSLSKYKAGSVARFIVSGHAEEKGVKLKGPLPDADSSLPDAQFAAQLEASRKWDNVRVFSTATVVRDAKLLAEMERVLLSEGMGSVELQGCKTLKGAGPNDKEFQIMADAIPARVWATKRDVSFLDEAWLPVTFKQQVNRVYYGNPWVSFQGDPANTKAARANPSPWVLVK